MSLVTALCGFVISVITARVLGPEGKGSYALAILIIATSAFLLNPGLYTSANYFFSSRKSDPSQVFSSVFIAGFISALVAFIAAWLAARLVITLLSAGEAALIGAGAAALSLSTTYNGALYGLKKIRFVTLWTIFSAILQTICMLYIGYSTSAGLPGFIGVYILFQGFDAAVKMTAAGSGFWSSIFHKPILMIPILRYGFSVYVGRVLLNLSQRLDTYILVWLLGTESLGYYSVSSTFAEQLWLLPMTFSLVMLTNITAVSDFEKQLTTVRTSQMVTLLAVASAGVLGIVSFFLIPIIYGESFRPATTPLLLSLPGVVAFSTYFILEPFFQARGVPKIPVKIAFWGAAAKLLLSLGLVYGLGMIGAAIAYSLSYIFQLLLALKLFSRLNNSPFWLPVDLIDFSRMGLKAVRAFYSNREVIHKINV